jgi:hypothetical protein
VPLTQLPSTYSPSSSYPTLPSTVSPRYSWARAPERDSKQNTEIFTAFSFISYSFRFPPIYKKKKTIFLTFPLCCSNAPSSLSPTVSGVTYAPTASPSTFVPSSTPSTISPTFSPSYLPTDFPSTSFPTTSEPSTVLPTEYPSAEPTAAAVSVAPSTTRSLVPSTSNPSGALPTSESPSVAQTSSPSESPTSDSPFSDNPTIAPVLEPTINPTHTPTIYIPTHSPIIENPTSAPSESPSTFIPSDSPSGRPTESRSPTGLVPAPLTSVPSLLSPVTLPTSEPQSATSSPGFPVTSSPVVSAVNSQNSSTGATVGGIIGALMLLLLAFAVYFCLVKDRGRPKSTNGFDESMDSLSNSPIFDDSAFYVQSVLSTEMSDLNARPENASVLQIDADCTDTASDWEEKLSNSTGKLYWYNRVTGESVWDMPASWAPPPQGPPMMPPPSESYAPPPSASPSSPDSIFTFAPSPNYAAPPPPLLSASAQADSLPEATIFSPVRPGFNAAKVSQTYFLS